MHKSIPLGPRPPPPPPPSGYCRAFARLVSPGSGAFANFAPPGARAFANPKAILELLTRTRSRVSYQNITTQKVLQQKKQIGASVKDRNKLKLKRQVLDFMPAFLHCLSSHNYIRKSGAIDVN